jgi:glycosyltransferase involved in cell wall biosynthesis
VRILLASDSYPPILGGASSGVHALATELARHHVVGVVTAWQRGAPAHETAGGVDVWRIRDLTSRLPWLSGNPYAHVPPPWPDPEATVRLRRVMRGFRPDVVHAYGWFSYSVAAALPRRDPPAFALSARDYGNICARRTLRRDDGICSGPAFVKCLACAGDYYGAAKGAAAVVGVAAGRPLLLRHTAAVQSCSRFVQDVMTAHLLAGRKDRDRRRGRSSQPWLVAIPDFRPEREGAAPDDSYLRRLPDAPFILFVGELRQVKGLDVLFAAYDRLAAPPPLVLVGKRAPDTPQQFPAGVTVIERVPRPTVLAMWDRALFGVFPSTWPEPLGNVVHEAMSRGRAVIGTTPGGHGEMITDGRTGLLVPAGETAPLAAAMQRLILDPDLRARLGAAGRKAAEAFSTAAVMPHFEEMYERLAASRTAR